MSFDEILKSRFWPAAWGCFGRAFIMLGLALLAWGVDDLAGFFANPVRAGIAVIVLISSLLLGWMIYRLPVDPKHGHDLEHWHYSLSELVFILSAFGDRRNVLAWAENPTLRWVGVGIYLSAIVYSVWANLTWVSHLQRDTGQAADNPVLLAEGPFQWTRYPTLLALILYSLGFALAFRSWPGLVFMVPLIYISLRRVNIWEKTYAERYKQVWAVRCQTSKRVIPFLY
jgi:protein-S-isoprenylcysteine O-methyltransferase Ste14